MSDNLTRTQRSYTMSRIRSADTSPEGALHSLLKRVFPRHKKKWHSKGLPGRPDAVLPELHLAVFADGCFFHGCRAHYIAPASNRKYWRAKVRRNRLRDRAVNRMLRKLDYHVLRIWEHDLKKAEGRSLKLILKARVKARHRQSFRRAR